MNECKIVEDLLPLYIEELTSEETGLFVKAHLDKCKACHSVYQRMTAPVQPEEKQIDYKKGLHRNLSKIIGKVVLTIAVIAGLLLYGLWELGFLNLERIGSPDGKHHFEVLDTDAGFFSGGVYIVTPEGQGRNLYGDTAYRDFNVWFSPDSQKYFAWIEFEDHDETWLRWEEYGRSEGDFEFKDTYYPSYAVEERDFLGEMEQYLVQHPRMAQHHPEDVEFAFEAWSDDSEMIWFTFSASDGYYGGRIGFDCTAKEFVLQEAYVNQVREIPVDSMFWDLIG